MAAPPRLGCAPLALAPRADSALRALRASSRGQAASLTSSGPIGDHVGTVPGAERSQAKSADEPRLGAASRDAPASAYVHLPFCKRRCFYCDFPVRAVGDDAGTPAVQDAMSKYVDLVCAEIDANVRLGSRPLQTVFFGGGTPSLTAPGLLERILASLRRKLGIAHGAEISMEADPGTFDAVKLRAYLDLGVSRFSVGVQAFQEELLRGGGRSHSLADVRRAIEDMHAVAPPSWSLDLISGLPFSTPAAWEESLRMAVEAQPHHVSVYDLQVEEGTPFGHWYSPGQSPLPSDATSSAMYVMASETLRSSGYEHYEVSNYAKPGHQCRHNLTYWTRRQCYAFGLGAASYLMGRRFRRPAKMAAYRKWVHSLQGEAVPMGGQPKESLRDQMEEELMLRLRLREGLDLMQFENEFGAAAREAVVGVLAHFVDRGLVEVDAPCHKSLLSGGVRQAGERVRLTDPSGWLVSNDIISDLFVALPD
ncbi:unnamed protein product [Ostreobium quekettii]|uniref:Radical S-adenosyl methionine domain-containing protein 1, mitochondrial n=1 Tax=Ostreobium quekettii TaxID=121088 RepID=A0A8S1J4A2_9CHLO|nr:unnamed protein product [Ostreobium quekettii]|eukprot:evm.model.scf_917.5 EVM.evm.TU.scf_917.5   scf_917:53203-55255(-)